MTQPIAPQPRQSPAELQPLTRCQIEPLDERQFRFSIDGRELTRWHFGGSARRPYFFPIQGPSGECLTRMGHPGAPNHDHHRSLWFAHDDLLGTSFWTEGTPATITQSQWYAIDDGDDFARIALELVWNDGHDPAPLVKQDVFMTLRPQPTAGERAWSLELQSDFRAEADGVELRQSNFGVLAVRVAKSLSVVFGEGVITGATGGVGEKQLFGLPNRWVNYSGPVAKRGDGALVREGLTLIDHEENPGHAGDRWASWHVRDDGWMGISLTRNGPLIIPRGEPLTCRYLLLVHASPWTAEAVDAIADRFDSSPTLAVQKGTKAHHQWQIVST